MGSQAMRTELWGKASGTQVEENPETLEAIRRQVESLPVLDRSLLALHYAGELSPKEIADGMSLSTNTVTARIRQSLEVVTVNLRHQGVRLPGPILPPDYLVAAICTGVPVPNGLREKVLGAVARLEHEVHPDVSYGANSHPRSWGEIATAFMMVASAAVAMWWFTQHGV